MFYKLQCFNKAELYIKLIKSKKKHLCVLDSGFNGTV